jgi:hypothetical protein
LGIDEKKLNTLNGHEQALILSLKHLSRNDHASGFPACLTWESFGARFYSIRINSFLVLGKETIFLSELISGSSFDISDCRVKLKTAQVFQSIQPFGPDLPPKINAKGNAHISVDWIKAKQMYIVLNAENGVCVDIFFALKREGEPGYILVLDQRKRLASTITDSTISSIRSKIPDIPRCINGETDVILGVCNVFSPITVSSVPKNMFLVSASNSSSYHGSLFDHPGCSMKIDVNMATMTALCQLFCGTVKKRKELANQILIERAKSKIKDRADLESRLGAKIDKLAEERICF